MPAQPPPWKRQRPAGPRTQLSEHDKARARARAARAGRRYPNLIDNMWAAQTARADKPAPTKPATRAGTKPARRAAAKRTAPKRTRPH
jgi:hypothetical protein